jgi:MFS family permease
MWISPRKYPDFAWTLTSRILINLGNALGTTMLLYFLTYGLKVDAPDDDIILLSLIYTVFVVIASLVLGRLSDSWGRRKPFVTFAAILQALAAILLALAPSFPVAMFAGALLGLGYGCFLSVDQALATQVLPDPADRGKDLGIMNIASAVPQAVAPLLGAFVVVSLGGFVGLFLLSGLFALLGAATVAPVKSVQ